jgi:hypothetical protein
VILRNAIQTFPCFFAPLKKVRVFTKILLANCGRGVGEEGKKRVL